MMENSMSDSKVASVETGKPLPQLPEAAKRALAEAAARRMQLDTTASTPEPEFNGRGGLDPARFGDWEVRGLAVDF
jgi:hypothetical protein